MLAFANVSVVSVTLSSLLKSNWKVCVRTFICPWENTVTTSTWFLLDKSLHGLNQKVTYPVKRGNWQVFQPFGIGTLVLESVSNQSQIDLSILPLGLELFLIKLTYSEPVLPEKLTSMLSVEAVVGCWAKALQHVLIRLPILWDWS